jgi:hypothetical protein
MAWVCAEPSRFRTSGNSDERFHVQRDVRHARTSHRTSRNGTGKSAWHSSNANPARRAGQILPATPGSVVAHSSAGNARVRVSPSAHRTRRRQRQYLRLRPGDCTSQPTRIGDVLLVVTGRTRPVKALQRRQPDDRSLRKSGHDNEARSELLTYLVVSQLVSRSRTEN